MKQYLKMADVFDLPVSDEVYRVDFAVISDSNNHVIGGFGIEGMSSHAVHAINSHDELVQMNQELLAALEGLLDIVGESDGVSGYHLNGDIAEWDEFEELNAAYDAVNKAKGGAA